MRITVGTVRYGMHAGARINRIKRFIHLQIENLGTRFLLFFAFLRIETHTSSLIPYLYHVLGVLYHAVELA